MIFFKEYSVYSIWSSLPYLPNTFRVPLRIECCWSDRRRIAGGTASCGEQPWIQMEMRPLHPAATRPSSWQAGDRDQSMALELGTPGAHSALCPGQCVQSYLLQRWELLPRRCENGASSGLSLSALTSRHTCCVQTLSDSLNCIFLSAPYWIMWLCLLPHCGFRLWPAPEWELLLSLALSHHFSC